MAIVKSRASNEFCDSVAVCLWVIQILMLSGIGPAAHLAQKHIRSVLNLPGVGQNLQDHVAAGGLTFLFDSPWWTRPNGAGIMLPRLLSNSTYYSFLLDREGPVYASPFCELLAFVNTVYEQLGLAISDTSQGNELIIDSDPQV